MPNNEFQSIKICQYDQGLLQTLFQMYGSVWPKVLWYCIANVILTYIVYYLVVQNKAYESLLTLSPTGHNFMAIIVSFLIVARAKIVYGRYMTQRSLLGSMLRSSRHIVQHLYCLTNWNKSPNAVQWRLKVVHYTIVLLRVSIESLAFESTHKDCWEDEDEKLMRYFKVIPTSDELMMKKGYDETNIKDRKDANLRAPIKILFQLRMAIMEQRQTIFNNIEAKQMHITEECKILQYVGEFHGAYNGLMSIITCPFPFPLVQMARTFLFFWVFTLPVVLVDADAVEKNDIAQILVEVFFLTFGFIGMEFVSIELDDPFGEDPNDFDDQAMAQVAIDDILLCVFQQDGVEAEDQVKALTNHDDFRTKMVSDKGIRQNFFLSSRTSSSFYHYDEKNGTVTNAGAAGQVSETTPLKGGAQNKYNTTDEYSLSSSVISFSKCTPLGSFFGRFKKLRSGSQKSEN